MHVSDSKLSEDDKSYLNNYSKVCETAMAIKIPCFQSSVRGNTNLGSILLQLQGSKATLQNTKLQNTKLHYTTLHYTTLH